MATFVPYTEIAPFHQRRAEMVVEGSYNISEISGYNSTKNHLVILDDSNMALALLEMFNKHKNPRMEHTYTIITAHPNDFPEVMKGISYSSMLIPESYRGTEAYVGVAPCIKPGNTVWY